MKRKNIKSHKKQKTNEPIVIEFNLSLAIAIIAAIIILIVTITTVKVVMTQIEAKEQKVFVKQQDTDTVTWVDSTEKDAEGNSIQVPVPKGFTASQVEGETTVSGGFVIYEGNVDWDTIIVKEDNTEESETTNIKNEINKTEETNENSEKSVEEQKETNEGSKKNTEEEQQEKIANDEENNEKYIKENNEKELEQNVQESTVVNNIKQENEEIQEEIINPQEENAETITSEEQTAINVFKLQKEVDQYVWVPVPDASRIYGIDSNGKYWGKLYDFPDDGIRTAYVNGWTEENGIMTINGKEADREPDAMANMTKYDIDSVLSTYSEGLTRQEFQRELEENFYKTIKSIEKYGGFYIGRYEVGDGKTEAVVRKMANIYHSTTWYSMYNWGKRLSKENNNIMTSMIWGSLWDETLQWFVDSEARTSEGTQLNYTLIKKQHNLWGNYKASTFNYIPQDSETPTPTETKKSGVGVKIPPGSSDYTKINNIYDMSGNIDDFTLETYRTNMRVMRMGNYNATTISFRNYKDILQTGYTNYGFRSMLIIK